MTMTKRIINLNNIETAVVTLPPENDLPTGIKITFTSGEFIFLWYDTQEEAEEFFNAMRFAFQHPFPGLYVIEQ